MKKNMNENFEITVDEMTEIFGDTPVEMSFRDSLRDGPLQRKKQERYLHPVK